RSGHVRQIIKGKLASPASIAAVSLAFRDQIFVADVFAFREVDSLTHRVRDIGRIWAEGTPIQYALNVSATADHVLLVNSGGIVQQWSLSPYTVLNSWTVMGATSAVELADGSVVALTATGALQRLAPGETAMTPIAFNLGGYGAMAVAGANAVYLSHVA